MNSAKPFRYGVSLLILPLLLSFKLFFGTSQMLSSSVYSPPKNLRPPSSSIEKIVDPAWRPFKGQQKPKVEYSIPWVNLVLSANVLFGQRLTRPELNPAEVWWQEWIRNSFRRTMTWKNLDKLESIIYTKTKQNIFNNTTEASRLKIWFSPALN